ncbi:TPA: GIY-YIG nuclease family protein [Pseudomonas aeruginosa]
MPDFYYTIKGKKPSEYVPSYEWAWPPVYSGLVSAPDKNKAKELIEEEYSRTFPLRVLKKDMDEHAYLLRIEEVDPTNEYILRRFRQTNCKECGTGFRLIDKYNDAHADYKGKDYCSKKCADSGKFKDVQEYRLAVESKLPPVIYQIRQRSTGMSYVGQTTQPFTLRWWQHLCTPTGCKFHEALRAAPVTDWEYTVLESISFPEDCKDKAAYIYDRERHWIETLNSVTTGFNTVRPSGINPQQPLELSHDLQ